ncbi:hypothetical protein COO60DRAFT_490199 [Scenedesmus sp. NREL 46B-D3]|nr:hypothetical protein COO60DRAFT_490199 [Scenedesmus sp. NREL 46B-D3]
MSLVWLLSGWACGPTLVFGIWYLVTPQYYLMPAVYGMPLFLPCVSSCWLLDKIKQLLCSVLDYCLTMSAVLSVQRCTSTSAGAFGNLGFSRSRVTFAGHNAAPPLTSPGWRVHGGAREPHKSVTLHAKRAAGPRLVWTSAC